MQFHRAERAASVLQQFFVGELSLWSRLTSSRQREHAAIGC